MLHWAYPLIYKFGQWFHQAFYDFFKKMWSFNFIYTVCGGWSFKEEVARLEVSPGNTCDHSLDLIYRSHLPRSILCVSFITDIIAGNWRVIASCACVEISNFKHRNVKMFLLNFWWEFKNLDKNLKLFSSCK